jgi:mannose/fructose/sorbose-specific phosphotransferase system IIA component
MTEILIVTHGHLGKALLETAGMISGYTNGVKTIGFFPGQGIEDLEEAVRTTLLNINKTDNILCLVDIPGGSPARVVTEMAAENSFLQVVSGVNLAMLIEVLLMKDKMEIEQLVEHAKKSACESVMDLGSIFRSELSKQIEKV